MHMHIIQQCLKAFAATCRDECGEEGPLFYFQAPCCSTVSLYFVDGDFVPNNGTTPLEVTGACASKLPKYKLCKTCGPFEFTVVSAHADCIWMWGML